MSVLPPDQFTEELKYRSPVNFYLLERQRLQSFLASEFFTPAQRLSILLLDWTPLLVFGFGYVIAVFALSATVGIAFAESAQASAPVFGLTQHEWAMAVYVTYNVVILSILALLIVMIAKGTRSQWVWRTASFLLGFLVKSIASIPAF